MVDRENWCIGVDLGGAETPLEDFISGIGRFLVSCLAKSSKVSIIGYGTHWSSQNQEMLSSICEEVNLFTFVEVSHVIEMCCAPLQALKTMTNSSLYTGIMDLKEGRIDLLITSGNSGALVVSVGRYLELFPNVSRPTFLSQLFLRRKDSSQQPLLLLDSGANYSANAHYLTTFAALGVSYWHWRYREELASGALGLPRLGLLNIGIEPYKGPAFMQEAYQLLMSASTELFRFIGNVEPDVLLNLGNGEPLDLLITDGFTGNILLKTLEAASHYFNPHRIDQPKQTQAAILYGVSHPIIKCHGSGSSQAIFSALEYGQSLLESGFSEHLQEQFIQRLGIKF